MQFLLDLGTIRLIVSVENSFILNRNDKNPRLMFDVSGLNFSPHGFDNSSQSPPASPPMLLQPES